MPEAVFPGSDGEAQATKWDPLSCVPQLLLDARGQLRREDRIEALRKAMEMCMQLNRPAIDDEQRLEDALIRIRPPAVRRHRGILPARPGRCRHC